MDKIQTVTYRFTRDDTSPAGFMSGQCPSTDAMNVVRFWEIRGTGRSVQVVEAHQDDFLVARLTFQSMDDECAAVDLEALCLEKGVKRVVFK